MTDTTQQTDALANVDDAPATTALTLSQKREMVSVLPSGHPDRGHFMQLTAPNVEELLGLTEKLPAEVQQKILEVVNKANPRKQGAHAAHTGFTPTEIKLYHGTGNDPLRPRGTEPGYLYSTDSRVIEPPFEGVIVGFYQGRLLWPKRDDPNKVNAPLCVSMDQRLGHKYGECAKCPLSTKPYNDGGCTKEIVAFLLDKDFTNLYMLRFNKSSYGAGDALVKSLKKQQRLWDRWFRFETQERAPSKDIRYFVMKASPGGDPKKPGTDVTDKAFHPLFEAFSKIIDQDIYYPQLLSVYSRYKNGGAEAAPGSADSPAGDTYDPKKLGDAVQGDAVDYDDSKSM